MTEEKEALCGFVPFTLPKDHPFTPVCQYMHDPAYVAWMQGLSGRTLAVADKVMLQSFLKIARERESFRLRMEAYVFYGLTTAFRLVFRS